MATNGLVVMTPSSIAYSGTSASINADGSVVFSACTSLSLNGVFTADYDNYMVTIRHKHGSGTRALYFRLRSGGTDQSSGNNYTRQYLEADSTGVGADRDSSQNEGRIGNTSNTQWSGDTMYLFGPYLAQPTATRNTQGGGQGNAFILDWACTHGLSSSYDGLTFFPITTGSFEGILTVFGFNQ